MKFFLSLLATALLAYAAGLFLPWWGVGISGLIAGAWLAQKPGAAFLSGFLAVFLLWSGLAFLRSHLNDDILASRFALLILKTDSPELLIMLTGMIGGIVSGLGTLSGNLGRSMFANSSSEVIESGQELSDALPEQPE